MDISRNKKEKKEDTSPLEKGVRSPVLRVEDLRVSFASSEKRVTVVSGVDLDLFAGQTLGVVGESGSGKSVSAMSIPRLLGPSGRIDGGKIILSGRDLVGLSEREMRRVRGREIAVVFQEPMTSLNPVLSIGKQMIEPYITHLGLKKAGAWSEAERALASVGLPDPEGVMKKYPHQLSGGMRQRVMIAMALASDPSVLIADEPTTALDVTVEAGILDLIGDICKRLNTAVLFITHDLGVVRRVADRVAVMYAGRVVEEADTTVIFSDGVASHPYTEGLMFAIPRVKNLGDKPRPIPGSVPRPGELTRGCRFAPRCQYATPLCTEDEPLLAEVTPGQRVRCHYPIKEIRRSEEHRKNTLACGG